MKLGARLLFVAAIVGGIVPLAASSASAKCYNDPDTIGVYLAQDLVAVCKGYDHCDATIAICVP